MYVVYVHKFPNNKVYVGIMVVMGLYGDMF